MRAGLIVVFAVALAASGSATAVEAQPRVTLPSRDAAVRVQPRTLFSVGTAEGREWEVFGSVGDVTFDDRENLYVLDRSNARVVVFDSAGRYVRTLGGRGGGPGELQLPQHLAFTVSGELVVSDVGRREMVIYDRAGRPRHAAFPAGSVPWGDALLPHPRGGVVAVAMGNPASRDARAMGEEVLLWYPGRPGEGRPLLSLGDARDRSARGPSLLSPGFHFALLPDGGVSVADEAAYTVRVVAPDGRTVRIVERAIAPRRVTRRDRQVARERHAARASGPLTLAGPRSGPLPPQLRSSVQRQFDDVPAASVVPVITGMRLDRSGNLWVRRSGPTLDRPGPIDVISAEGRYLRTLIGIDLPRAFSRGGRAAYVRTDALGVPRVEVVRL